MAPKQILFHKTKILSFMLQNFLIQKKIRVRKMPYQDTVTARTLSRLYLPDPE